MKPVPEDAAPDDAAPDPADQEGAAVAEVVLDGELDISTLDRATHRVEEAERGGPRLLVVDLSQLRFVDSSGVRLVLLAQERARAEGRRVAVRLGTGPALRVFQALGLVDKLDVLPPRPVGETAPGART
ncbi:STAS domain-containing protein [Pseudonocardia sp. RS11V-5]|uniref:STAS domain-containing protein n=1 Tax=Pseudonocardia terrae TaxID=2905831 RepID=UPI001E5E8763|nr:STAS domain-containing protein [Pseudonocardia terrae]MCE3554141.1 STAS domain-containing protein [Pseudonocardia terrae]